MEVNFTLVINASIFCCHRIVLARIAENEQNRQITSIFETKRMQNLVCLLNHTTFYRLNTY
jgi:hypothetical protein